MYKKNNNKNICKNYKLFVLWRRHYVNVLNHFFSVLLQRVLLYKVFFARAELARELLSVKMRLAA